MNRVEANPRLPVAQPLENQLPTNLKALIVAVSAIAAAVFGLWLAGLAGLALGALAGTGLGLTATHLISRCLPNQTQEIQQEVIEEAEEVNIRLGTLKDPSLLWVTGTRSPTLALMLAIHRTGKVADLVDCPAIVMPHALKERGISPVAEDFLSPFQKECVNFAVTPTLRKETPFDLQKEIEKAYKLPGDDLGADQGHNRLSNDMYLDTLQFTISRALQYGMNDLQKNALKEHLQNTLIPIFDSVEKLYDQMALFPENQNYIENSRRRMALYPEARAYNGTTDEQCAEFRRRAVHLLQLFDQIQPLLFNEDEQDLIVHSCPLVFGSTTLAAHPLDETEWFGPPGQLIVDDRPAYRLGQDLQYVYTTASNIDLVARILGPWNVQVRDLQDLCN